MADAVTASEIWLDQTLHGYSGGHRLLTGSAKLADAEMRTMLVLSDASGGRSSSADRGYLTGYPLPGASKFVLARTWPAPELSRPGCVWTHSLLIDFADLATISTAVGLMALLRRPIPSMAGYDVRIKLTLRSGLPTSTSHTSAGALLDALYLDPSSKVEMRAGDAIADEELVLAVWLQQWPRLRRSFRFCSLVGADRSVETGPFDIQIAGSVTGPRRTLVPGARLVDGGDGDLRLGSALRDLHHPGDLRSFLRNIGGDVPGGRSAMISLCQLYDALNPIDRHGTSFSAALGALDLLGSGQARAARTMVLERALEVVENVDDKTLEFVLDSAANDEITLNSETAKRIGGALWRRSPRNFAEALSGNYPRSKVAIAAIAFLDREQLAKGVVNEPDIAKVIARSRPDVLTSPSFWQATTAEIDAVLGIVDKDYEDAVLSAAVSSRRNDIAAQVVRRFGSARTLAAIGRPETVIDAAHLSIWLDCVAKDPLPLGIPLSTGSMARTVVAELAKRLDPDAIPNEYGADPWLSAAQAAGNLGSHEENRFAAFLIARGLGRRTRSCAELLLISFDRVHSSLADSSMPSEGWQMIERRLPWLMPWGDWDRCGRVREAVAAKFIDLDLNPGIFARITDSQDAFRRLAKIAASSWSGRRYLERVRKIIRHEPDDVMQARTEMLGKLI